MANLKARTKAQKALDLKMSGLFWQDVADQLGYNSAQAACKAVHDMLKRTEREITAEYRAVAVMRLDGLLQSIWTKVLAGDIQAVMTAVKIEDRRGKLMGLDLYKPSLLGEMDDKDVTIHIIREAVEKSGIVSTQKVKVNAKQNKNNP